MAELIGVVGESGSGKSFSIRNLDPKTTFVVNVAGKVIPVKGAKKLYTPLVQDPETKEMKGNMICTSRPEQITRVLGIVDRYMPHIKTVVIDDAQYIMGFEALDRAVEKGYDKFSQIANNFYSVLKKAMSLRDDIYVCFLMHSENVGSETNPSYKMKTVGKMIDNILTLEGLFNYVFFTTVIRKEEGIVEYKFITQSDGTNRAKSVYGCFEDMYIDNDLKYVIDRIEEFSNE